MDETEADFVAQRMQTSRTSIKKAMIPLSPSLEDEAASLKRFFQLVYLIVEQLLDAPLPDDKGMEKVVAYYTAFLPKK
jgi:hypothetical protein